MRRPTSWQSVQSATLGRCRVSHDRGGNRLPLQVERVLFVWLTRASAAGPRADTKNLPRHRTQELCYRWLRGQDLNL